MRSTQHPWKILVQITATLALAVVLAACINPFSSADRDSTVDGSSRFGRLELSLANEGIGAQTVLPGPVTPEAYDVVLTRDGFDDVAVLGIASSTVSVPGLEVGEWSLEVTAFIGGEPVMRTAPDLTVAIQTGINSVPVQLFPISDGTGSILVTVSWPAGMVDGFNAGGSSISDLVGGPPQEIVGDVTITGNTLSYDNTSIGSGFFQLRIVLTNNGVTVATIFEIVHVYQNLQSVKTIALTAEQISAPPAPPTNMVVEFTGENQFIARWTDASNTEEGFRVYEQGNPTPLATVGPGAEQTASTISSPSFVDTATEVTLEVVAFNSFGESPPLSFAFRVLPIGEWPRFEGTGNTNSPLWAARANPGRINWGTMIVGGGSAVNLYSSTGDISDVLNLPTPTALAAPPYNLAALGPFNQLQTYNWRLENVGAGANSGRVIYRVESFTIRDGVLFVNQAGSSDAAGSSVDPLDSVLQAVTLAEPGETVRILGGTYVEPQISINKSLVIEGESLPTIRPADSEQTYVLRLSGPNQVTIRGVRIEIPDTNQSKKGLEVNGLNAFVLEDSVIEHAGTSNTNGDYGVEIINSSATTVRRNRFLMNNNSPVTGSNHQAIRVLGSPSAQFDSNRFQLLGTDLPGAREFFWVATSEGISITNNVFYRQGTGVSADVSLRTSDSAFVAHNTFVRQIGQTGTVRGVILLGEDGASAPSLNVEVVNNLFAVIDGIHPRALYVNPSNQSTFALIQGNAFLGYTNVAVYAGNSYPTTTPLNATDFAAGNFTLSTIQFVSQEFDDIDWFRPETPANNRSLVLAGASREFTVRVPNAIAGAADIRGDGSIPVSVGAHQVLGVDVIGALGPAGGLVFYENPNYRFAGETWRFLEADPQGVDPLAPWSDPAVQVPDTQAVIGSGLANTQDIVGELVLANQIDRAAQIADNLDLAGFADWFLPSSIELAEMHSNLHVAGLGGFVSNENTFYWSSTQDSPDAALGLTFFTGDISPLNKTVNRYVRPARRF